MKKTLKYLVSCFMVVMVFALGKQAVLASAPSSITVKRAEVLSDLVTNHEYGFTIFTTSDGQIIYCMDVDKKALASGQTATLSGNGDAGLLYILQNGYPSKSIRGNDEADKYITQAAIWWYVNEDKVSSEFKNATSETDIYQLVPNIKSLVEAARSAKDTQATPTLTVNNNSKSFTLSDDGYYESGYISASIVGADSYSVKVTGGTDGTVITDENGNVKTKFSSSEKFKVRIPASELKTSISLTITLSATGSIQRAKIYKPSDSSTYQRVVGLYTDDVDLNETVKLTATPKNVCVYDDGKYYGSNGDEVDENTYNKQCRSCEIDNNKYYGKDGREVNEDTYKKECNPSCEYTDDKYYDKDGNEVTKEEFDASCGTVISVPNTSANIILLGVAIGVLAIVIGGTLIYNRANKENKIVPKNE